MATVSSTTTRIKPNTKETGSMTRRTVMGLNKGLMELPTKDNTSMETSTESEDSFGQTVVPTMEVSTTTYLKETAPSTGTMGESILVSGQATR